jgi:type I restriction enzyme S subunit
MSFPRYLKYKDSGVEWVGRVPTHWEVWKLAHAFARIGSGTTPKTDNREYYDNGEIPWINTGDLNDGELDGCEKRVTALAISQHASLKTYPAGSLVIAMYGATIGKLSLMCFPATVNQACCVFSGPSAITPKFMFYWFIGLRQKILSLATGGGQPNISQDILRTLRVACPKEGEQTYIAEFLDRETAKIDELIAEQRRLMDLLKEKRQAVISEAVTKGLSPYSPTKPSSIESLGNVPEHWEVKRLSQLRTPSTITTPI